MAIQSFAAPGITNENPVIGAAVLVQDREEWPLPERFGPKPDNELNYLLEPPAPCMRRSHTGLGGRPRQLSEKHR
ncbi:hypothetical protein GCM10023198_12280 [Promicromonospora umidemergens]|uniref:Uncharacterized protein n=1 Tax=Promicromonospora umidemergens TaxID=629679 RepID=A0ABP8WT49_9MICO